MAQSSSIHPIIRPDAAAMQLAIVDPARLATLHASGLVGMPASEAFDVITRQASQQLNAPLSLLTLVDQQRDFVVSHVGLPEPLAMARQITDSPSFCQLTITQGETVVINDTQADGFYRLFPSVEGSGVRAHLGVPLFLNGRPIGNCCVIDFVPREWTATDIENLENLAGQAVKALEAMANVNLVKSQMDPHDVSNVLNKPQ